MINKMIQDSHFSVKMTFIRVVFRVINNTEHFRQRNIKRAVSIAGAALGRLNLCSATSLLQTSGDDRLISPEVLVFVASA
jgi:protein gp37